MRNQNEKNKIIIIITLSLFFSFAVVIVVCFFRLHSVEIPHLSYNRIEASNEKGYAEIFSHIEAMDSTIITIKDREERVRANINCQDIFGETDKLNISLHGSYYCWVKDHIKVFDGKYIICKSINGRYIIIDAHNYKYLITASYRETILLLCCLILITIMIFGIVQRKLNQKKE